MRIKTKGFVISDLCNQNFWPWHQSEIRNNERFADITRYWLQGYWVRATFSCRLCLAIFIQPSIVATRYLSHGNLKQGTLLIFCIFRSSYLPLFYLSRVLRNAISHVLVGWSVHPSEIFVDYSQISHRCYCQCFWLPPTSLPLPARTRLR